MKHIENKKVEDVMTHNVIMASTDDSVRQVAKILSENKISGVGVKDSEENIVGIVSKTDIVKAFDKDFDKATAEDIMTPPIGFIHPESTLKEAMEILSEKGIHRLLVVSDKKPVGILCTNHIVEAINTTLKKPISEAQVSKFEFRTLYPEKRGVGIKDRRIDEVMTSGVIYVPINSTVREVSGILAEKHINGVVVTAEDSEMLGIVSKMDIIKAVGKDLDELIAADIMCSPVKTIDQCKTLKDAAGIMKEDHIHRLLVLFGEPCARTPMPLKKKPIMVYGIVHGVSIPAGMLSAGDIVKEIAESGQIR